MVEGINNKTIKTNFPSGTLGRTQKCCDAILISKVITKHRLRQHAATEAKRTKHLAMTPHGEKKMVSSTCSKDLSLVKTVHLWDVAKNTQAE